MIIKTKTSGFGLVEVLIALLVVSLGLLSLASFETALLKTTGHNKARSEALNIAKRDLEHIRYLAGAGMDQYEAMPQYLGDNDALGLPATSDVAGVNANFTVNREISGSDETIKLVKVEVTWPDVDGNTDSIILSSEIVFQDPLKSALTGNTSAATAVPSPRQSASEDVRPASEEVGDGVISPTPTPLPATGSVSFDNNSPTGLAQSFNVTSTKDDQTTFQLERIADDSRYYSTSFGDDGVIAVYLCQDDGSCDYIQNHFGGVSLSTAGTVYSTNKNGLGNVGVVWSSSEVTACYTGEVTTENIGGSDVERMDYECIYAGNCQDNPGTCQHDVTEEQVIDNNVGPGGEFGNLGLIGLDDKKGDQLCFLEDSAEPSSENILVDAPNNVATNESYLFPTTTRSYVTRKMRSNGQETSEGINRSYRNHNFLVVERDSGKGTNINCHDQIMGDAEPPVGRYQLAPRQIVRINSDNSNLVGDMLTFDGVMPAITLQGDAAPDLAVYIEDSGSCYVRDDGARYACVVPSDYDDNFVRIYGATTGEDSYSICEEKVDDTQENNFAEGSDCSWHF